MFMSDLRETLLTALGQSQTETDDSVLPGGSPDFRGKHILLAEDNEAEPGRSPWRSSVNTASWWIRRKMAWKP